MIGLHAARGYGAITAVCVQKYLAYWPRFWLGLLLQVVMMVVLASIWTAVLEARPDLAVTHGDVVSYILIAQLIAPFGRWGVVYDVGRMVRLGEVGVALLRPLDFQGMFYAEAVAQFATTLVLQFVPAAAIATLWLGLRLPADPMTWACFAVSLLLGHAILFSFDWMFAALAFHTTEVWGLHLLREGFVLFFGGSFIPLSMLEGPLARVANVLPFGQALYVPAAVLADLPRTAPIAEIWLTQCAWLAGMTLAARLIFGLALRRITIHGG